MRPFRVEIKTKRRAHPVLPPSIWGDAATLLKAAPDQPSEIPRMRQVDQVVTVPSKSLLPVQAAQARRILPDLRTIEVAASEPAAPLRVTRTPRKKGGNIMLHDTEKMVEHQEDTSPSARDNEPAQAIHIEASSLAISEGDEDIRLSQSGAETAETEASEEANPIPTSTSAALHEPPLQPSRKWVKGAAELPRWEKWRRRLPGVCR